MFWIFIYLCAFDTHFFPLLNPQTPVLLHIVCKTPYQTFATHCMWQVESEAQCNATAIPRYSASKSPCRFLRPHCQNLSARAHTINLHVSGARSIEISGSDTGFLRDLHKPRVLWVYHRDPKFIWTDSGHRRFMIFSPPRLSTTCKIEMWILEIFALILRRGALPHLHQQIYNERLWSFTLKEALSKYPVWESCTTAGYGIPIGRRLALEFQHNIGWLRQGFNWYAQQGFGFPSDSQIQLTGSRQFEPLKMGLALSGLTVCIVKLTTDVVAVACCFLRWYILRKHAQTARSSLSHILFALSILCEIAATIQSSIVLLDGDKVIAEEGLLAAQSYLLNERVLKVR